MKEKPWLSQLKPLAHSHILWDAYVQMLEHQLDNYNKTLYQSSNMVDVYRAQGAVFLIEKLMKLRDEVNASN